MIKEKKGGLNVIFDSFMKNSLFNDKSVLQVNYSPESIPHREKQIETIAGILAPALRGDRISNLFLYGKTGTGKTLSVKYVTDEILKRIEKSGEDHLKVVYINCKLRKVADTEYRILAEIIHDLGGHVPVTGLPTDAVYNRFVNLIDDKKQMIILILDEIDQAVKKISDGFLYTLTRLNSELKKAQIGIIGISNSLTFMDNLDPRVKSSLGEEELIFPPYNAPQLQNILRTRANKAFAESVLGEGVIEKCAAYAAREHGDARRALDLLRVAGELAERNRDKKIEEKYIDEANHKIERDKMISIIESEPKQFKLVLLSIMYLTEDKNVDRFFTGNIYNKYQEICEFTKNEILTQRRISDIIAEFDMLGIINADVVSKGRQGRTREIKLMLPPNLREKAREILHSSLNIGQ